MSVNLSSFKEKQTQLNNEIKNQNNADSFIVRENVINGKTDTLNDTNSKGGILSLKTMSKKGKRDDSKRESIYKYVLKNQQEKVE